MKILLTSFFLFLMAYNQNSLGEPLDSKLASINVVDPTMGGLPFCHGQNTSSYICYLKGYPISEVIEFDNKYEGECNLAVIIGNDNLNRNRGGSMFQLFKVSQRIIKSVKCSKLSAE